MSPPPLPQEILDTITDWVCWYLDNSDAFQLLKRLAVTSQHFTHRAQSHLFCTMEFGSNSMSRQLKMIEAHPTLFAHVRTLVLCLGFTPLDDEGDDDKALHEDAFHASMLHVLDWLRSFTKLIIVFSRSEATETRMEQWATWTTISSACRELLEKAMSGPSLNALYIQGLRDIPLQIISALQSPTRILLDKFAGFTIEYPPDGVGHTPSRPPIHAVTPSNLQWLSCHRSGLTFMAPLLPSLSDIPHLSMEIAGILEHTAAWGVLGGGGLPRVESLVIIYSNRITSRLRDPNLISHCLSESERARRALSSFPRLRYLSVTLNAKGDSSDPECQVPVPPFLLHFLAIFISRNPQPSLQVIKIVLNWYVLATPQGMLPYGAPCMISRDIHNGGWAKIDGALSNQANFPYLRAVRAIAIPHMRTGPPPIIQVPEEDWISSKGKETFKRLVGGRAKKEMRSVLTQVGARMEVDVGLDKEVGMRVDDIVYSILPADCMVDDC